MSSLLALTEAAIVDGDGEFINIGESGLIERGQLERFLLLSATELGRVRSLIRAFPGMIDVDKADSRFLPAIAAIVGIEDFNYDLPIEQQREEIKRAVEVYKRKGTQFGIRRQIEVITRLNATIDEMADNVLVANYPDRMSATFVDPDRLLTPGRPGDPASYSIDFRDDHIVGFDVVMAYMFGVAEIGLSRGAVAKLARVIGLYVPADVTMRFVLLDESADEAYDRNRLVEDNVDTEGGDVYDEGSLAVQQLILSNNPVFVSNQALNLSGYVGLRGEVWSDQIVM